MLEVPDQVTVAEMLHDLRAIKTTPTTRARVLELDGAFKFRSLTADERMVLRKAWKRYKKAIDALHEAQARAVVTNAKLERGAELHAKLERRARRETARGRAAKLERAEAELEAARASLEDFGF